MHIWHIMVKKCIPIDIFLILSLREHKYYMNTLICLSQTIKGKAQLDFMDCTYCTGMLWSFFSVDGQQSFTWWEYDQFVTDRHFQILKFEGM